MRINKLLQTSKLADKTYIVGGAVRDSFLNLPINDIDYVITVSQEEFLNEFPNAEMVGNHFPVYLIAGDEVALSRTEKSNGNDYNSFQLTGVGVPIEEDLLRRDFTINAIAKNIKTDKIIDPFNGIQDLNLKLIKITHLDSFKDDPVRILRALRFASRYNFDFDSFTELQLIQDKGSLRHVTKERIVLEFQKVWKQSGKASSYFRSLNVHNVIDQILPEFSKLDKVPAGPIKYHGNKTAFEHTLDTIDNAQNAGAPFHVMMAMLFHDFGKAFTAEDVLPSHFGHESVSRSKANLFFADHRFDKKCNDFVPKAAELHMKARRVTQMKASTLVKLGMDIGKNDFNDMLTVFNADHKLNTKEMNIFNIIKEVIFNTDLKTVADVPGDQRKQKAHQLRVTNMKLLQRKLK